MAKKLRNSWSIKRKRICKVLDLSGNKLKLKTLGKVLDEFSRENSTLEYMDLSNNRIGHEGFPKVLKFLERKKDNPINYLGCVQINLAQQAQAS